MISLKNIATIARYEAKVLWRNWFFRIFALIMIAILIFFNIGVFSPVSNSRWFQRAISSGIPYANMVFLNLVQVVVLVFLATGIIKNNKKLDTNEVFYVRPLSNADLVLGKALALLTLFFWLNFVILAIAMIVNATTTDTSINFKAYLCYPLLISFPNIIFTTSLSFLLVSLIRNQAISVVLLLGLMGVILIYFQGKYYFLADYIAFKLPLHASDMVGFSYPNQLLLHRAMYLCLGIAFLSATILLFKRLPQKKMNRLVAGILTVLFVAGTAGLVRLYLEKELSRQALRNAMITLNGEMAKVPNLDIQSCHLDLQHSEKVIHGKARLTIQNSHAHPLKELYLTLNPGLKVTKLLVDDQEVNFRRASHLIFFESPQPLSPGAQKQVEVSYHGTIDEAVCYLDIQQEQRDKPRQIFLFNIDKRFVFLEPDYVLLTREALWYPQARAGYNKVHPGVGTQSFTDFRLRVKTRENLLAISQGKVTNKAPGIYEFLPEFSLPQISLIIGNYDQKSIRVDSTDFNLFVYRGNDYFSEYFDQVQDTLATLIRDLRNGYELDQGLKYKFSRLQLVETPIHFNAFTTFYESHQAYVQPETVLLPEKGGQIWALDLKLQFRGMERQARRNNQMMDEKDQQANVFNNFVKAVLTRQNDQRQSGWRNNSAQTAIYELFPNLYWFQTGITSKKWPLLNKNLSDYLNQRAPVEDDMSRNWRGISFTEDCNNLMREKNLEEILKEEENFDKIIRVIDLKGDYLLKYLEMQIGQDAFKSFLYDMIDKHAHQTIAYDDFRNGLLAQFQVDIDPMINRIYTQVTQPAYIISDVKDSRVRDGDRNKFQVTFRVENIGDADGLIKVHFNNSPRPGGFTPRAGTHEARASVIPKNQKKEIRMLLDERPERIIINTLISKNIPSIISLSLGEFKPDEKQAAQHGEVVIRNDTSDISGEIIVDNEDQGFTTFTPIREPYLRKVILERNGANNQKYHGEWRSSNAGWRLTTGSAYYGRYVRSAHFTRSGDGSKVATWQPKIKESAYYDVYVHLTGNNNNRTFFSNRGKQEKFNYQYYVFHDDGEDEITVDVTKAERGWNFIGSFYFSRGKGKVTLSDESESSTVFADAVKWVKQ